MAEAQPFAPFLVRTLWPAGGGPTRWPRPLLSAARIAYAVVRDIAEGHLSLHAASLVYTTILSLVPLMALAFSVLKGFGVHYRFEPLLMNALAPLGTQAQTIAERLLAFVDNMNVGVLGAVGLAVLFYTAISVVQKIEQACNEIWRARDARPWARKFTDYLSVLLIGPVLLFSALGVWASVMASDPVRQLAEVAPLGMIIETVGRLLPFLLVVVAFAFVYKFLPNTPVKVSSAVVGSVVAAMLWVLAGWGFGLFAQGATSYTAIYSALAALILFLIWLNVSWTIILVGAAVAFYLQHPEHRLPSASDPRLGAGAVERIGLGVAVAVARAFVHGERPPTTDMLASRLLVSEEAVDRALDALADAGLVAATTDDPTRWLPAKPPASIAVATVLSVIRGRPETPATDDLAADPVLGDVARRIEGAVDAALDGLTLETLATGAPEPGADRPPILGPGGGGAPAELRPRHRAGERP